MYPWGHPLPHRGGVFVVVVKRVVAVVVVAVVVVMPAAVVVTVGGEIVLQVHFKLRSRITWPLPVVEMNLQHYT
jgi:hypothetical protein